jgi:hypothetical protein
MTPIRGPMGHRGCSRIFVTRLRRYAESFFSTLEHERLSRRRYVTRAQATPLAARVAKLTLLFAALVVGVSLRPIGRTPEEWKP